MNDPDIKDCFPGVYLIHEADVVISHNPPFDGQYSDLPFQDPWWKILLAIIAIILFIAAVAVAAYFGVFVGGVAIIECCSAPFFWAVGLAAGSGGSGIAAGASDERDSFRRGQDNTIPSAGELTTGESLKMTLSYPEPIALGRPFSVTIQSMRQIQTFMFFLGMRSRHRM